MTNLARKLIEAIQNSLLDKLFMRLWPILYIIQLAVYEKGPPLRMDHVLITYAFGAFICVLAFVFLAWALGILAIYERPKGRSALERIHDAPRNGFEVWSVPPVGGRKPPRLARAIVMALGQTRSRKTVRRDWLPFILWLAAMALLLLRYFDQAWLAPVSPYLVGPGARDGILWGVLAIMFIAVLRAWAVDCRKQLGADAPMPAAAPTGLSL